MTEGRQWNIRQVYLYLVCFATLMMLIVGLVQMIMGVVDLVYPDPNQGYIDIKMRLTETQQKNSGISPDELERQIQEETHRQELSQKYYRVKRFINSLVLVVVSLPVYLYHWRKIQKGIDVTT